MIYLPIKSMLHYNKDSIMLLAGFYLLYITKGHIIDIQPYLKKHI